MADDLVFMQQQAARRVQQMQEHSRQVVEAHQTVPPPHAHGWPGDMPHRAPPLYIRPQEDPLPPVEEQEEPEATAPDTEQWFLLGLALLLFRSGCRPELTLALLYLAF